MKYLINSRHLAMRNVWSTGSVTMNELLARIYDLALTPIIRVAPGGLCIQQAPGVAVVEAL